MMQKPDFIWYSPTQAPFVLEGFPYYKEEGLYRRLSAAPPFTLPEGVESLAWCTSGGQIRFRATFRTMRVKVCCAPATESDHMTSINRGGFDLYLGKEGTPRYYSSTRFTRGTDRYESAMAEFEEPQTFECVLNFPLYRGVQTVLIGFDADAVVEAPAARAIEAPVVVYGTSITQGGCCSRPGMVYTNILSRRLNVPFVNLGFSGSGRSEPEVAYEVRRIKASLFIHDAEANAVNLETMQQNYPAFIRIYREANPDTPYLVVSKAPYAKELLQPTYYDLRIKMKAFQKNLVEKLQAEGDHNIWFLDGEDLYPDFFEENTVDGVHATDLGFWMMAENLEPVVKKLLGL